VRLGDMSQAIPSAKKTPGPRKPATSLSGAGTGLEDEDALFLALAEGLERYSACIYEKEQFVSAAAEELGENALDLDTIPKCSEAELSRSRCPLAAPDKKAPMRWVRGLSLLDGRILYLPAVMVYLNAGLAHPAERICLPITTGSAIHTSYERALLGGILEVIERDAISVVWLQKLSLPRIEIDRLPPALAACWARVERSSRDLEYLFFDATAELGIPTVYGLQIAPQDKRVTTLVSCSTDLDPATAVAKVIRDMAAIRVAFWTPHQEPENWDDFGDIFDGATYMARSAQAHAFEFLLQSGRKRRLSEMPAFEAPAGEPGLGTVLECLRRHRLDAYAVDLTTDEGVRAGVRAVRVLIPGLQPLSFHHRARYLGHPRLYEAPARMGYPVYREQDLNPWPQPFA
jgi:ribosomal protein S12 methylthiotransferase accessory factor